MEVRDRRRNGKYHETEEKHSCLILTYMLEKTLSLSELFKRDQAMADSQATRRLKYRNTALMVSK